MGRLPLKRAPPPPSCPTTIYNPLVWPLLTVWIFKVLVQLLFIHNFWSIVYGFILWFWTKNTYYIYTYSFIFRCLDEKAHVIFIHDFWTPVYGFIFGKFWAAAKLPFGLSLDAMGGLALNAAKTSALNICSRDIALPSPACFRKLCY